MNSGHAIRALDGVSASVAPGKTLAIVGESGCGKSTLARVLMQIEAPTNGEILIDGRTTLSMPASERRQQIQMIFQDPYGSLNPRKRAWQIIAEPLIINSKLSSQECKDRALEVMAQVGLRPEFADRYPHMFSGGQRQRIGIARGIILHPRFLICDEPVSALDVSIQAQVINLLIELQDLRKLGYLFISHDLSVVRHIADSVLVMYLGKVAEYGSRESIFDRPLHPYTRALLASTPHARAAVARELNSPSPHPEPSAILSGELPSAIHPPSGCAFHKRCPIAIARCRDEVPELRLWQGREVACHLAAED